MKKRSLHNYKKTFLTFTLALLLSLTTLWAKKVSPYSSKHKALFNFSCVTTYQKLKLSGKWEFYWHQLLTPQQIKSHKYTFHLVKVPKFWSKYKINNHHLPHQGFATYHAVVILPKKNTLYAIKLKDIFSAYKLWLNDSLVLSNGKVGKNRFSEVAYKHTNIINFYAKKDTIDIVLQVSNFHHRKAGITEPVYIGKPDSLLNSLALKIAFDLFLFGGLLLFGLYNLWLYNYRKEYTEALVFGLAALFSAIYSLFSDEYVITTIFPKLSWEITFKINYLTNYLRVLFLLIFFKFIFKNYLSKLWEKLTSAAIIVLGLLSLLPIFTPTRIFSYSLILFIAISIYAYILATYGYLNKFKTTKQSIFIITLISLVFLGLAVLNDILREAEIIKTIELSNFGIFIFVSTQSVILTEKNTTLYKIAERLTYRFKKINTVKSALIETPINNILEVLEKLRIQFNADKVILFNVKNNQIFLSAIVTPLIKHKLPNIPLNYVSKSKIEEIRNIIPEFIEITLEISEPILFSNRSRIIKFFMQRHHYNFTSVLISRLTMLNKITGIIYLEKQNGYFSAETKKILSLITTQIATIINNIQLLNNLENINKNLQNIVHQRTAKIEEQNRAIRLKTIDLDEKIEELRVTADMINAMNEELLGYKNTLEQKNKLLLQQTETLKKQINIVKELNKQITDSILYAKRIQLSLLNAPENRCSCPHFIIYKAKEIVSGLFWWTHKLNSIRILAIGDVNKHGVPGAFLSILSFTLLNEIAITLQTYPHSEISSELMHRLFYDKIKKLNLKDPEQIKVDFFILNSQKRIIQAFNLSHFAYAYNNNQISSIPKNTAGTYSQNLNKNDFFITFTKGFILELIDKNIIKKPSDISATIKALQNLTFSQQKIYLENLLASSNLNNDILILAIKCV